MTALTPVLHVTGDIDGVALWWAGERVEVFGSLWDARLAKRAAEQANTALAAIFNPIPAEPSANDTAAVLRARFQGD